MATYSGPAPLSTHVQGTVTVGDSQATTATVGGADVEGKLIAWVDDGKPLEAEISVGRAEDTQAAIGARFFGGRGRGVLGAMTAVHSGDNVLDIIAVGHDGIDFEQCARIDMEATGVIAAGQVPGRVRVRTANAAGSLQDVAVFDHQGRLGIQTLAPDGVLDATPDTITASSYSYPTRVTSAQRAALVGMTAGATVYDTDLSAYYVYDGAAWSAVGGSAAVVKGHAMLTMSADQVSPAHGSTIAFDTHDGNLTHSAVNYSVVLKAGKTYKMEAYPAASWTGTGVNYAQVGFYDLTNSAYISPPGHLPSIASTSAYTFSPPVATYTVGAADIEVCVKKVTDGGSLGRWWATSVWGSKAIFQEV